MTVSPAIADAYWAQVKGAIKTTADDGKTSYWGAPCDANLPDFSLQIGDGTAVIPGLLLNAGLLSDAAALPREFNPYSPPTPPLFFVLLIQLTPLPPPSLQKFLNPPLSPSKSPAKNHIIRGKKSRTKKKTNIVSLRSLHRRPSSPKPHFLKRQRRRSLLRSLFYGFQSSGSEHWICTAC